MGLLETGGEAAFFGHRLYDGADDAVEEGIGKIGQERVPLSINLTLSM